jgi:hypothetical protein
MFLKCANNESSLSPFLQINPNVPEKNFTVPRSLTAGSLTSSLTLVLLGYLFNDVYTCGHWGSAAGGWGWGKFDNLIFNQTPSANQGTVMGKIVLVVLAIYETPAVGFPHFYYAYDARFGVHFAELSTGSRVSTNCSSASLKVSDWVRRSLRERSSSWLFSS